MKNRPTNPLPPAYQLSSIGDPPVRLALIAATLMRTGISEDDAITAAHRLIGKAENYLMDQEVEILSSSDLMTYDLDRVMSDMKVKGRAIRKYLQAVRPTTAGVIWQKALAGERVFTYAIRSELGDHQAKLHRSRSEKAVAGRKKGGQT